jgi:hypothetical protein
MVRLLAALAALALVCFGQAVAPGGASGGTSEIVRQETRYPVIRYGGGTPTVGAVLCWDAYGRVKNTGCSGGGGGETWDASFDGQGQVVVSGTLLYRPVASTGTIAKAALVGDVSGAVTVTVKKYTPAGGALGSSTTLGTIALATAQHNSSTPSWSVTAGDVLEFSLGGTITSVKKVFVRLST